MKPNRKDVGRFCALALAAWLAGCSDYSQHRFGGVRTVDDAAQAPPQTGPGLAIPNPPSVAHADFNQRDDGVKPARFEPRGQTQPEAKKMLPVDPNLNPQVSNNPMRALYERARQRYADMDSYIFRMKRREVVNGRKQPEEVVQVKLRREPYSVYLKWLNPESKGRETVYVRGKYENKMQLVLAANDAFPFSPAGMRWSIAPDDPMTRAKSRYPITETGFGPLIERFGKMVAAAEKGDSREGTMKYAPRTKRPEFAVELEGVYQVLPAMSDPQLPKGGERWLFFDPANGLPALVIAHDSTGEVEYYCFDHVQYPVRLDDDDFNPDRLWRK
jgi:hypothetical protein